MNAIHYALIFLGVLFVVIRIALPRHAWTYLRYVVLTLTGILFLSPFYWLFCAAIKDPAVLMTHTFLPPVSEWSSETLNLKNFNKLFEPRQTPLGPVTFWRNILNSLFFASTTTIAQLFFCSLGGYALAKYKFKGRSMLIVFMLASMMIPPILLFAPMYRLVVGLGWIDTYWALIVPGAANAFGMFLFRQAIMGVPDDIIEAGRIDGCNEFSIYYQLIMPLVRPMTGAFCLIVFLGTWNNFLGPQIFLHSETKLPLPVVLSQLVGVYVQQYGVFLAGTLIAIIPPAILFFALQREFVSGLTSGAVKG